MPRQAERGSPLLTFAALVVAAALVLAGLALAKPWRDDDGFGIIPVADAVGLEIGPRPGMLAPDFPLESPDGGTPTSSRIRAVPGRLASSIAWSMGRC